MSRFSYSFLILGLTAAAFFASGGGLYSQTSRTRSMGNLNYSVFDEDNSLDPFTFAGNPAWLQPVKDSSYLDVSPSISNSWGSYRRKYDSEGTYKASAYFEGVKKLDSTGTFLGRTYYFYENRRSYYRTLLKDPYNGEGFFYTDTTSGDFRYNGPAVEFMYSWTPVKRFYAGASVKYGIIEGLKKNYTYAKTMFRDIEVNTGAAYRLTSASILGANFRYFDTQETVNSSDVNDLEVLVKNFRGEKYAIIRRDGSVTERLLKKGIGGGVQMYQRFTSVIESAARIDYIKSQSVLSVPYENYYEDEAKAEFNILEFQFQTRFALSNNLSAALNLFYNQTDSWTKNSWIDVTLWKWNTKQLILGGGASYRLFPSILLAFECEFTNIKLDSSKYIDSRFRNLSSNGILIKAGAEYRVSSALTLRGGYNYGFDEEDILYGGEDALRHIYTMGAGLYFLQDIDINISAEYTKRNPKDYTENNRSDLGASIYIRFNTF